MPVAAKRYIEIEVNAAEALRAMRAIEGSSARAERSLSTLTGTASKLGTLFRGYVGFAVVSQFTGLSDAATQVDAQLRAVTGSSENASAAFQDLLKVSNKTGTAVDNSAKSYANLSRAVPVAAHEELVQTVDLLGTTLAKTGASTEQATSAQTQFTQAMSRGKVSGDEFVSLAENAPALLYAWQQALGRTGEALQVTAEAGAFTTESFFKLLPAIQANIDVMAGAGDAPLTVSRALGILRNEAISLFRSVGQEQGVFGSLAGAIQSVARGLSDLRPVLLSVTSVFGAIVSSASTLSSTLIDVAATVGGSLVNAFGSLANQLRGSGNEVTDFGGLFSYVFNVEIPTAVESAAVAVELAWNVVQGALAGGLNFIVTAFKEGVLLVKRSATELELAARSAVGLDTSEQVLALRAVEQELKQLTTDYNAVGTAIQRDRDALIADSAARIEAIRLKHEDSLAQRTLTTDTRAGIEALNESRKAKESAAAAAQPTGLEDEVTTALEDVQKIGTPSGADAVALGSELDLGDVALGMRDLVGLATSGDTKAAQQQFIDLGGALDELAKDAKGLDLAAIQMERDRLVATAQDVLGEDLKGKTNPIVEEMKEAEEYAAAHPIPWTVSLDIENALDHVSDQVGYRE